MELLLFLSLVAAPAACVTSILCRMLRSRNRRPGWWLALCGAVVTGMLTVLAVYQGDLFQPKRWDQAKAPLFLLVPLAFGTSTAIGLFPAWLVVGHYRRKARDEHRHEENMKLISPMPEPRCRAILREQVQRRSWSLRFRLFRCPTSHVAGVVEQSKVELGSSVDRYSKRFVGVLRSAPEGAVLEGHWEYPFGFSLFGDGQFDEEEIFRFLAEYTQFKPDDGISNRRR